MGYYKSGVVLYGIGGADAGYAVLRYRAIWHDDVSIRQIDREAELLRAENPGIERVFVIDNSRMLRAEYRDAVRLYTYPGWIMFRDILERQGIEWPKH